MIPNKPCQTWKTKEIPNSLKHQFDSWNSSNPQLSKNLFNDIECEKFILDNFGT